MRGKRAGKDTSPDVGCWVDGPAFEAGDLAEVCVFKAPPPIALDATALTSGAVTCVKKPGGFVADAFDVMIGFVLSECRWILRL